MVSKSCKALSCNNKFYGLCECFSALGKADPYRSFHLELKGYLEYINRSPQAMTCMRKFLDVSRSAARWSEMKKESIAAYVQYLKCFRFK